MSAIRDITSIDLSNMNTLEGKRSIEVVVDDHHELAPPDTSADTSTVPTRRDTGCPRELHRSRDARPAVLLRPQRSVPAPRGLEIANLKR